MALNPKKTNSAKIAKAKVHRRQPLESSNDMSNSGPDLSENTASRKPLGSSGWNQIDTAGRHNFGSPIVLTEPFDSRVLSNPYYLLRAIQPLAAEMVAAFGKESHINNRLLEKVVDIQRKIIQFGCASNFLAIAESPYLPWFGSHRRRADIGFFRAKSMTAFSKKITMIVPNYYRDKIILGWSQHSSFVRAQIELIPEAVMEAKFIRRNTVSVSRLFKDLEKVETVLRIRDVWRPVVPILFWVVRKNSDGNIELEGESRNPSLFRFLNGDWAKRDNSELPGQHLSMALSLSDLSRPHFTISSNRNTKVISKAVWIHHIFVSKVARLVAGKDHVLLGFIPHKIADCETSTCSGQRAF